MKHTRRIASLLLALVMVFAMAISVAADDTATGTITISNAAKGETYAAYKLFDATVVGSAITYQYQGDLPTGLTSVFEKNSSGNVVVIEGKSDAEVVAAVQAYVAANKDSLTVAATDEGEGSAVVLTVPYGYYAVTTTQGTVISVDSTNPNATVYDKNSKEPGVTKTVEDDDLDIGATAKYTVTATTSNYMGEGETAKQVTKYEIFDTLTHEFLTNVTVTKITIGGTEYKVAGEVPQFTQGKITIPWVDEDGNSLYANGAQIVIEYEGTVTDGMKVGGAETTEDYNDGNVNTVTLQPYVDTDEGEQPWNEKWEDKEEIYTYAAALQKVDQDKKPLAGAKFAVNGLTVTGSAGSYTVVSYDPTSETQGTEMECDSEGQLVILGLSSDSTLTVYETEAPAGYNKLVETTTMTPQKTSEEIKSESKTIYYDANGNVTDVETSTSYTKTTYNVELLKTAIVVINQAGSELPSTGGMGTTLFYVVGGLMVAAAVILLVTKKRMAAAE